MVRSFILHSEVEIEGDPVDCFYFFKPECRATLVFGKETGCFKPTEEDQKIFCTNRYHIRECPRLQSYEVYLKALGLDTTMRERQKAS